MSCSVSTQQSLLSIAPRSAVEVVVRRINEFVESRVLSRFALSRLAVPADVQHRRSRRGDGEIVLEFDVHVGAGPVSRVHRARTAASDGSFSSLTLLALPRPGAALPALAVDLVGARDRFIIAVLDLAPVAGACLPVGPSTADLASARASLAAAGKTGEAPEFLRELAVDHFTVVRQADPEAVAKAAEVYCDAFAAIADNPGEVDRVEAAATQRRYMRRLQENEREHRALAGLFGADWAQRFLVDWMFSVSAVDA